MDMDKWITYYNQCYKCGQIDARIDRQKKVKHIHRPTRTIKIKLHVGKYTIYGWYGIQYEHPYMTSMWWSSPTNYPTFNHAVPITWATKQTSTTSHEILVGQDSNMLISWIIVNPMPKGSMYDTFTYIYHTRQLNVGIINIPYLDPMGHNSTNQGLVEQRSKRLWHSIILVG